MRPGPQGGLQQYRSIILLLGPLALIGLPALMATRLATPVQAPEPRLDTSPQRFHGKRAATLQRELVERSPYRSSGQANNERAVACGSEMHTAIEVVERAADEVIEKITDGALLASY